MTRNEKTELMMNIAATNIGGVAHIQAQFRKGFNFYEASNASGKSSMVKALMLPFVDERCEKIDHFLHAFSKSGSVKLDINDDNIHLSRTLTRKDGEVRASKELVENADMVRLFAFADEGNELLQAIRTGAGANLKKLVLDRTGYAVLKAELKSLVNRREALEDSAGKIKRTQEEIEKKTAVLKRKQSELEKMNEDIKTIESQIEQVGSESNNNQKLKELNKSLAALARKYKETDITIFGLKNELKSQHQKRDELENKLKSAVKTDSGRIEELEAGIHALENDRGLLELEVTLLSNFLMLENKLDERSLQLMQRVLGKEPSALDNLLYETARVYCPVCSQTTTFDDILKTKAIITNRCAAAQGALLITDGEKEKLIKDMNALNVQVVTNKQLEKLDAYISSITNQLRYWEGIGNELREKKEEAEKEIESLKPTISASGDKQKDRTAAAVELKQKYKESAALQNEIEAAKKKVSALKTELKLLSSEAENIKQLDSEIESVSGKMTLIESDLINKFNNEIQEVFKKLSFNNIEMIKLNTNFAIEVIRKSIKAGRVDQNSVVSLAKSEREITALVFMLSGYKLFNIRQACPFVVLDDLEYLDRARFHALLDYYKDIADFFIVTKITSETETAEAHSERAFDESETSQEDGHKRIPMQTLEQKMALDETEQIWHKIEEIANVSS